MHISSQATDLIVALMFAALFFLSLIDIRTRRRIDDRGAAVVIMLWAIARHLGLDEVIESDDVEPEVRRAKSELGCDNDDTD